MLPRRYWLSKNIALPRSSLSTTAKDPSRPARLLAAEVHLTMAECRAAGGSTDLSRAAMAKARPVIDQLASERTDDPAIAEITRRAAVLRATLGD